MKDWDAGQYLKFEDERTRPSVDLLNRVPLKEPRNCVDLGCGPGNSTELIVGRFPSARVLGLDNSPDMLSKARGRLPGLTFEEADLATWQPKERFDLIFANAVLQWLPNHPPLLGRLVSFLTDGGCLAVQMPNNLTEPSHRLMRQVAQEGPWTEKLASAAKAREEIGSFDDYYTWLTQAGCSVDIWQTTYVHPLENAAAIAEWFKSTGLKPYLDPLTERSRRNICAATATRSQKPIPLKATARFFCAFPVCFSSPSGADGLVASASRRCTGR